MAKFAVAEARLFKDKFVCRRCKSIVRATNLKIIAGSVTCRKCGSHTFKGKRKK